MSAGRLRRLLIVTVGVVALALVASSIFAVVTVRRSFPEQSGTITISGLNGPVDIERDASGIPQIYADTPEDLFFAQGFVHAQDRFYEMDFRRHVTSGRLAELVGEGAADTDALIRTLGWRDVAEREVEMLDDSTYQLLEAYSNGVNEYIDGKSGSKLSLEYAVLALTGPDYRPEQWTPADSVSWMKAMAWDLRSNMDDEIARVRSTQKLSVDGVEELYPNEPVVNQPIVGDNEPQYEQGAKPNQAQTESAQTEPARAAVANLAEVEKLIKEVPTLLGTGEGIGSNSWVVSGDLTSSGQPILANDPHLAPSMPGIWYQVGLHCRELSAECQYDVSGFSFSGMPGVVVGHNAEIAWGVTTMYADVADLYLEKVDGDSVEYDGKQEKLTSRTETIKVAGGEDRKITVRSTRHGPLISDLADFVDTENLPLAERWRRAGLSTQQDGTPGSYAVALQWTALTPRNTYDALFGINRAQNWDQFREAASDFAVPSQNLVYADRSGHIGYQSPGEIPVRGQGDGRWPVPGWDADYDWKGRIPFDELPSVYDPADGVIVTANNQVIDDTYKYVLGADTAHGYRSQRIADLLATDPALTVADMLRIQSDDRHPMADILRPHLLGAELDTAYERSGQDMLASWNGQMNRNSGSAAYFAAVWKYLLEETFHDDLPEDQWPEGNERWFTVMTRLLNNPNHDLWDNRDTDDVVETRDDVIKLAMVEARDDLTRRIARDPEEWTWGELHQLELVNATLGESGIGVVESLFNRGPEGVGGGGGIIDATSWDAREGYEVTAVPSMRMVVDLANLDDSRWIQLTGNSGHAFHDNYTDQFDLWRNGRTLPWAFSREAVGRMTENTLRLKPPG